MGTEIKYINGHWYSYERKTSYDTMTKNSKKVSWMMLGTITERGFVAKKLKVDVREDIEILEYGVVQYFYEKSTKMR